MIIFHHNDLDGRCSAFWCTFVKDDGRKKFIEVNYGFNIDFEKEIEPDEKVYVVDFSFEPEDMKKILKITKNIVWIDHHITAIAKYDKFSEEIPGLRHAGNIAACALTYIYLNVLTNQGEGNIVESFSTGMFDKVPFFTKLISDWDSWTLQLTPTKKFVIGCELYTTNPENIFWTKLYSSKEFMYKIIEEGEVCIKYRDEWSKELLKSYGFEVEFEGYKCFAVNLGRCNSDYFKSVGGTDKYDILIPFIFNGKKWSVSLYSGHNGVDVSKIAMKYGGGGHRGASGFSVDTLPFERKD